MKLKILLQWVFLFICLFIYWIVDSVLLLQAQVSHMAVCLTGKVTQRAVLLWPVLISCSEQINVWWIMFSAVFQEDRELRVYHGLLDVLMFHSRGKFTWSVLL